MTRRFASLACCALLVSCAAPQQEVEPIREERPSALAAAVHAEKAEGLALLEAPARVITSPSASAIVSSLLETRVLRVLVQPGQRVAAGEPLLEVLMPDVLRAAGALSSASIRLAIYDARYAKLVTLVEQGLARASELVELEQNRALAKAEQQAARATLRTASITDKQAQALLTTNGSVTLRAPMAGIVTSVSVRPGEVRAASSGSLLEIATLAPVRIEARFSAALPASAQLEWLGPEGSRALDVESVAPQAGATDGARLVWLRLRDEQAAPLAGSFGRVRVVPAPDWMVVPAAVLHVDATGVSVQVRRGERIERVSVELILRSRSDAVVTGITRSDELVSSDVPKSGAAP